MGKGKSSPRDCLEWSLVSGRRSIFSDRQDFVHKLEFEISKGKKKKAEGTFACVEMTTLVTFCLGTFVLCLITGLHASPTAHSAKWWWAEQGLQTRSGLSCSGEISEPSPSLLHLHAKEKPPQPHSGLECHGRSHLELGLQRAAVPLLT